MALRIKLKNSVVQDRVPTTSDLPEVGELAVNANINSIGGFMRASDNSVVKIFGPGSLSTPTASTTVSGISELATNSETTTGTATDRVVTPAGLNAVTVAERSTSNSTYLALAGGTLTGVLTATAGSNSAPSIHFGDSDSGIFGGTNTVSLTAGGTTRLTADTGVSVVGTLAVTGAITSTSDLTIAQKLIHAGDTDTFLELLTDTICFDTAGSEAIRVDSSQRLLVGTSSSRTVGSRTPSFQIEGSNNGRTSLSVTRNSADNAGSSLVLAKSRGTSNGSSTIINDDDQLGVIRFIGADGTDVNTQAAQIAAFVDGTPGSNDMPGRLIFSTTADGAASPTTRLTIDSAGTSTFAGNIVGTGDLTIDTNTLHVDSSNNRVGIGTTSPSVKTQISVADTTAYSASTISANQFQLSITNTGANGVAGILLATEPSSGNGGHCGIRALSTGSGDSALTFSTRGGSTQAERMRIDSSGRVGINESALSSFNSIGDDLVISQASGSAGITIRSGTSNTGVLAFTDGANTSFRGDVRYDHNGDYMRFSTNGDERMRIDSSGDVGIGTTDPGTKLDVAGDIRVKSSGVYKAAHNGSASAPLYTVNDSDTGMFRGANANELSFSTGGSNAMIIDSSQQVGIGTTSPAVPLDVHGANETTFDHVGTIRLSGTDAYNSGNAGSGINFNGKFTSGGLSTTFAQISGIKENTSDEGFDGALTFGVRSDASGQGVNIERMRIDSSGNVGIGTTSPNSRLNLNIGGDQNWLQIDKSRAANEAMLQLIHSAGNRHAAIRYANADDAWKVGIDGTEAFVFANGATSTGDGTTRLQITSAGVVEYAVGSSALFQRNTGGTNTTAILFNSAGSQVGKIFFNNTDTFYSTGSSDRTLKKNFENWTETILTSFQNLNPQKFNFLQEEDTDAKHKGFIAQDLADQFPEAFPIDPETDKYGFNPSGMVVYLMKAIQELEAKVAALEAA